ncbi:MAG: hypothetical protein C5S45_02520 [Candidatus Methanocomedens sp.]|nr:MAG: hypothetical protein C5S45_02520 [ANME-2 cluster archaeon]
MIGEKNLSTRIQSYIVDSYAVIFFKDIKYSFWR